MKSACKTTTPTNCESDNEQNNIIILRVKDEEEIGISVDEVEEVLDIDERDIQKMENTQDAQYVKGIVNQNGRLLTIIEIDNLLN